MGDGNSVSLGSGSYTTGASVPVRMKFNSGSPQLEVYINGASVYAAAGSGGYGAFAFGGDNP